MTDLSEFEKKYSAKDIKEAANYLAVETNQKLLIAFALKSVAFLTSNDNVELMILTEDLKSVRSVTSFDGVDIKYADKGFTIENTPYEKIINTMKPEVISVHGNSDRLCLPMIGSRERIVGFFTVENSQDKPLDEVTFSTLQLFTTLIGVSLERISYYYLAVYDGLTGLYNRRQFDIRLKEELSRVTRYGGDLSLLLIDVDHFKLVNDTFGHQQGDIVLIELAEVFLDTVRNNVDIACRYGGEEYIAILPSTNLVGATIAAERFRQNCEEHPFSGQEKPMKVTVSCGVASVDKDTAVKSAEFIKRADEMLYKAKKGGRNQVKVWE